VLAQAPVSAAALQEVRATDLLSDGWRFKQAGGLTGVERPDFDDSGWSTVSVPHTWNRVGNYLTDTPGRVNTPQQINKAQGIGWYRLSFTPGPKFKGKRAWIEFDAASRSAEVWLNGVKLGAHAGGFSRFRLDATAALKQGVPNLLVVKTDNTKPEAGSTTADILPLAGDFFVHGGLYRSVRLIATDPVHLDMLDFGGPGVYAKTTDIQDGQAKVDVASRVRNDGASAAFDVVTRLVDATGAVAAEKISRVRVDAGETKSVSETLAVPHPRLWQGVADPYLYRLVVEVRRRKGQVVDRLIQPFGIRQMRFDPEHGFFLNGKPLRLHGVGYHQDAEGKGWAMSDADTAADFATIREMGANTIRLTHYQHGRTIHDLADRYGLILWDEIPLVSAWTVGGAAEASPGLLANARQQMIELIRQNSNSASVAVWGIANEVDFGNSWPLFLVGGTGRAPDPKALLTELNALAKAEDPSRPTTQANCCEGRLFGSGTDIPVVAGLADLAGANRYFGWYFGTTDDLGPHLDAVRATRPAQPLSVSEYGAGGAITMHSDDPLGGPADSRGRDQPEEYMSFVHERSWATLNAKPYLWGTWLWNSFDFATTVRREGDADDINTKGLVTYDRKVKKDPFFFYKANWTDTPTVHINGRRYIDRAYSITDVRVYSNAASTTLTVNGASLDAKTDCPQRVCVWPAVRLAQGPNRLVATGHFTSGAVGDEVGWTLDADHARSFRIDSGTMLAARDGRRFGSDAFFEGGRTGTADIPADYGKPAQPAKIIGTSDRGIAATYREGDFRYRLPVSAGRYKVTLTFMEPKAVLGERVFTVTANNIEYVKNLDIVGVAGAPLTALQRTFDVTIGAAGLELHFAPSKGDAIVSAVEIEARQ
jgi:beta-galactosidase